MDGVLDTQPVASAKGLGHRLRRAGELVQNCSQPICRSELI